MELFYNIESSSWKVAPKSDVFTARSGHSATAIGSLIFVFGGINIQTQEVFNDLLIFDTENLSWTNANTTNERIKPSCRNSHSAVLLNENKLLFFGGSSPTQGPMNDMYLLNISTCDFEKVTPATGTLPSPRDLHAACTVTLDDKEFMYISGGRTSDNVVNEVWKFDILNLQWHREDDLKVNLCSHTMFSLKKSLITFGGWDGKNGVLNDFWTKTVHGNWKKQSLVGSKIPVRFGHDGVASNEIIYVFGGMNIATDLNSIQVIEYHEYF